MPVFKSVAVTLEQHESFLDKQSELQEPSYLASEVLPWMAYKK